MLIDSHCHLPHELYKKTTAEIIHSAKEIGVGRLILIGTSLDENRRTLEITESYDQVYCCLGIYPHEELGKDLRSLLTSLKAQIKSSPKVLGIGEIGIDITNWQNGRSLAEQIELFEMQVELAKELDMPISIHNRNGTEEILSVLERSSMDIKAVFHCFTQDWEVAKRVLDKGYYISFTGIITYPKNDPLRDVVKKVPADRYLIETDAPYLPPQGHRGEINYPEYVKIVAENVAQVRGEHYETVEQASYDNTCAFFRLVNDGN